MITKSTSYSKIFIIVTSLLLTILFLFATDAASAYTTSASTGLAIRDNATGGDCTLVGNWDVTTKTCTLTTDIIIGVSQGYGLHVYDNDITLDGNGFSINGLIEWNGLSRIAVYQHNKSGITVKNLVIRNFSSGITESSTAWPGEINPANGNKIINNKFISPCASGIHFEGSNGVIEKNDIACDTSILLQHFSSQSDHTLISENRMTGGYSSLYFTNTDDNTIRNNTIFVTGDNRQQAKGLYLKNSSRNLIYNNNFLNYSSSPLSALALVEGGSGNIFNLQEPAGGNYWSTLTGPDTNDDGFVDSPYVSGQVQDNLPWTAPDGWVSCTATKPELSLILDTAYWASYSDYSNRHLSAAYDVYNVGAEPAVGVSITTSTNTAGVTLITDLPFTVGDINGGEYGFAVLRYHIPSETAYFRSSLTGIAADTCGTSYSYPN